jgi:hypothetical protein
LSPREGLEQTLAIVRLVLAGALRRTLATTNPIESALSVTQRVMARVTRRRDGEMQRRWRVAGRLRAESQFRPRDFTVAWKLLDGGRACRKVG